MTDTKYTTMRVPKSSWELAAAAKGDNETWGEYLERCANARRVEMTEDEVRRLIREELRDSVIDEALY
jgi:hypothetical protein